MKRSTALKQLLRAPLKMILTFLLIAAASFALFSRVMDYTVTTREIGNAESFYSGVAALDNTVPDVMLVGDVGDSTGVGTMYETEDKPWPTKEQLERFSSLPGVTLTDQRYMTAGLVEDYERLQDNADSYASDGFVIEGTYRGYEEASGTQDYINLLFDDVKVLAGNISYKPGDTLMINTEALEDYIYWKNPYPRAYWEELEKGSRCLAVGDYSSTSGMGLELGENGTVDSEECFCVVDGLSDDYLETEEYAYYKNLIKMYNDNLHVYDIVYTADMRAVPRYNERNIVMSDGRILTAEDERGCVVSDLFLTHNHLSIGDTISIRLGDKLRGQNGRQGAKAHYEEQIAEFNDTAELEIIGAYKLVDSLDMRRSEIEWSYTFNTIFVPASLLPVEVPADYETGIGEYSVFIEDAHDIESFLDASEPLITEMDLKMRFSDGGWTSIKDSFETGVRTAFLTMVLYLLGAALALLLAVYLYVGRNKNTYAIMRTLGVPVKKAQNSIVLPLVVLSVFAIPIGGAAGLFYAKSVVLEALESMMKSAPYGYVLGVEFPVSVIILSLFLELAFTSFITLFFLWKMRKTPPLELLQGDTLRAGADKKAAPEAASSVVVPVRLSVEKLPTGEAVVSSGRKYRAPRHVAAYILRHMRRSIGKTAVSFILAAVLTAGVGMFEMALLTYQDTYQEIDVKGKALGFSSTNIDQMSKSNLVRDLYYHGSFFVRIGGGEIVSTMVFMNDIERYLSENNKTDSYEITYAKGYDASSLDGEGPLCLIGKMAADAHGIKPGDDIPLLADTMYESMHENFGDDPELLEIRLTYATKTYKVAGIIDTKDAEISDKIFGSVNFAAESLYSQAFQIDYSEFFLADNNRADNLSRTLQDMKDTDYFYGQTSSFYIDTEALKGIGRICDLLEQLFPIAVVAAVLIGIFGPGLVIMQSAKEAAFLRVLGVTKKRCRCMLVFEQTFLCIAATLLVAGGLILFNQGRFLRGFETLSSCWGLYLLGSICGAFAASILITRHKVLELLHVKE